MNLNLFEDHFSLIINLDQYCQSFSCRHCGKMWKGVWTLRRHERPCTNTIKKYVAGSYQPEPTVFEQLADEGIVVDKDQQFYPYHITYDFECYFEKSNLPASSGKLEWQACHVPLSASVCSNVPGFIEPQCFVTNGNPDELIAHMIEYMHTIQETAAALLTEEHQKYHEALVELLHQKEDLEPSESSPSLMEDEAMDEDANDKREEKKAHPLAGLKMKYEQWMTEIPVIGFNSA